MINSTYKQLTLNLDGDVSRARSLAVVAALDSLSKSVGEQRLGAIFTRAEVVDFILNLVGYSANQPLHKKRILEPSFGGGDFLLPIVRRLLNAWRAANETGSALENLRDAIHSVELHRETYLATRGKVFDLLKSEGFDAKTAQALVDCWLLQDDFLLAPLDGSFDFVVGNPPYIRQEMIPLPLLAEYRTRYKTMYDRADIYIPFIERSLSVLTNGGVLGFICSDRWMKNRYGGPLRRLIAEQFHLKIYVDMVNTPAFHSDVIAYPAITIISRDAPSTTRVAKRPTIEPQALATLAKELRSDHPPKLTGPTRELAIITHDSNPWLLDSTDQITLIRRLEQQFFCMEEVGCQVGIGVATGADKVFISDYKTLNVEPDRKLPLATTKDIVSGKVQWLGQGVINPFLDTGGLVDLNHYPLLRHYLETHRTVIANRHCAQKNPTNWYRTIDRINPSLASKPKLLIPDIKEKPHIVFEDGHLYPHHNLYYVLSDEWDLRALQAVLLSAVTQAFVATYSTKMHGGFLRFQAQYLRRIRLPRWVDVPATLREILKNAATNRDIQACNSAMLELYKLNDEELNILKVGET